MHRLAELIDNVPFAAGGTVIAVCLANADAWIRVMIAAVSDSVTDATAYIALGTTIVGLLTASIIALFWLRKLILTLLHDRAAFRKGKLPKVDPGSPS